jgi:hypothetical protein
VTESEEIQKADLWRKACARAHPDVVTRLITDEKRLYGRMPPGSVWALRNRPRKDRGPFHEVVLLAPIQVPRRHNESDMWEICAAVRYPGHVAAAWVLDVEHFLTTHDRVDKLTLGEIDYDGNTYPFPNTRSRK